MGGAVAGSGSVDGSGWRAGRRERPPPPRPPPTSDRISPTSSRSDSTRGPSGSAGRRPSAILGRGSVWVQQRSAGLYAESRVAHPSNAHTRPSSNRAVFPWPPGSVADNDPLGRKISVASITNSPSMAPHDAAPHRTGRSRGQALPNGFQRGRRGYRHAHGAAQERHSVAGFSRPRQPRAPRPRWGPRPRPRGRTAGRADRSRRLRRCGAGRPPWHAGSSAPRPPRA